MADEEEESRAERYRRSRSPSFGKERATAASQGSLRQTMSRVVNKLQEEGPRPPDAPPPTLRARVQHVVQKTFERESAAASTGASPSSLELLKSKVGKAPQKVEGTSNLRQMLNKVVDETRHSGSGYQQSTPKSRWSPGGYGGTTPSRSSKVFRYSPW